MGVVLGVCAGYLGVCLALGWRAGTDHQDTAVGWVAGDRTLGLVLMYFIMGGTVFSAFAFLGLPGWAYSRGVAATYILGYGAMGFVPIYFLGPRAARLGAEHGFVTQAELVSARFGGSRGLSVSLAVLSLLAFVPYLALQIKGAGYVLEAVTGGGVPSWAGGAVVYGVVLVYVLRSGVLGVGWTNTFQGLFMMALAWVLGLYLPWRLHGGVGPMFEQLAATRPELLDPPGLTGAGQPWTWTGYTTALWMSAIGFFAWPHLFMKAFTAESPRTLERTALLFPTFQLFLVPLLFIGFAGVGFDPAPLAPDQILPHLLVNLDLPEVLVGLFCAGALAASMSSGDSMLHAAASIGVRDGLIALGGPLSPRAEQRATQIALVVILAAAYGLAVLWQDSLVALLLFAFGPIAQFMPGVLAALYLRRVHGPSVLLGLLAGALLTTWGAWADPWPWDLHEGLPGLVLNIAIVAVGSRFWGTEGPEVSEWLAVARGQALRANPSPGAPR